MKLILFWLLNALALIAVAYLVPDIHLANFKTALVAALVIGLVNMLIRPILLILTLPITIFTLGLFILVINILQGFTVNTLFAGIVGAVVYSVISWLLTAIFIDDKKTNQ
jgi:putative membrane protein